MVRCGSKNGHPKGIMCSRKTGLDPQYMLTSILGSTVNIIGGCRYDHLIRKIFSILTMNKMFI